MKEEQLWEEKNLTEQEKKSENKIGLDNKDSTKNIKNVETQNVCEDIGKIKKKEYDREYYHKNKKILSERRKIQYVNNRDKIRESRRKWYLENREKIEQYKLKIERLLKNEIKNITCKIKKKF